MRNIISIDPGNKKCGLLLADIQNRTVIEGRIVRDYAVIDLIIEWQSKYSISKILLGNGTTSKGWQSKLISNRISSVFLVEERRTTLRAKDRYFELWPPSFLLSWLPKTLIFPPQNLDSVAALILIEDYLGSKFSWPGVASFKTWPLQ